ncbi:MAG: hypothetical protein KJ858_01510 [Nanoarchaeota archaeon]|nr:hypothetical protein [Nanoarchaeota archaeon]
MDKRGSVLVILIFVALIGVSLIVYFLMEKENTSDEDEELPDEINESSNNNELNDSSSIINETHAICSNNSCVEVEGAGDDNCSTDSDCQLEEVLPDLIISNISLTVSDEETNETTNVTLYEVTVSVVVKNIGDADANQSVTRVSFASDSFPLSSGNCFTPAISAGQETTIESSYEDLEKGRYSATAFVDGLLKIKESNEENNGFGIVKLTVSDKD